ncbi:hypothetical protein CSKR_104878, partial [Clonorchis sinensis]
MCKVWFAFANLRHLWHQNGVSLNLKGRVYQATVRAVLLYGCETWPIRAAELRRGGIIIIIIDSMTPVFNTDASLPLNHDLFESLIVKNRRK